MNPEPQSAAGPPSPPPPPPPRKRRVVRRVLLTLLLIAFGVGLYSVWREVEFRRAVRETEAAGLIWVYEDPFDLIAGDWRAMFRKATWSGGARDLTLDGDKQVAFARNNDLLRRLRPKKLVVVFASGADLRALNLPGVEDVSWVEIAMPTELGRLDGVEAFASALVIEFTECKHLADIDAAKKLHGVKRITFIDCPGFTQERVAALSAALPKAIVTVRTQPAIPNLPSPPPSELPPPSAM